MTNKNLVTCLDVSPDSDFSIYNIPFGIYSDTSITNHACSAIGDYIISPSTSRNVLVVGDNAIVPENVDGFVQLNGVYIPKVVNSNAITYIDVDYTCNEADGTVLVDAGITNIDVRLPSTNLYETVTYTVDGVLTDVPLDYYLVCLKYADKVDIHILSGKNENDVNYYGKFLTNVVTKTDKSGKEYLAGGNFSVSKIKAMDEMKFSIELNNLEEKIQKIAKNLKETLDKLYAELSSFQFNVETIISGVDEKGKIIDDNGFNTHSTNALTNLVSMDRELRFLLSDVLG